jgi:hypothetical protein
MNCIFCGTDIEDNYCYECEDTCNDMGLDYNDLMEVF